MSKKLLKGLLGAVLASVAVWGMSLTVMAYEIHPETECDGATYTYVDGEAAAQGMIGSEHHYKICSVCGKAFQEHHSNVKFTYVDEHTHSITCGVCGNEWEHTSHENEHVFHSGENKCHFCGWVNPDGAASAIWVHIMDIHFHKTRQISLAIIELMVSLCSKT